MDSEQRALILNKAESFFNEVIVPNHIKNLKKLKKLKAFKFNPFVIRYLASFLSGEVTYDSIARALVYPRILGTSIATSFGQNIQRFCTEVLSGFGSAISGVDIEFIDQLDGRKKYCQVKSGPETINKDDIETISRHFLGIKGIA